MMLEDRKRAASTPPLGDFYAVVERERNDAAEARRREEAEKVYEGIAEALRGGGGGVEFVEPDRHVDGVHVCLFDDHRDRLYVFAKSVSDKRVVDILSALLTQRDGMYVDDCDWLYDFYRTTTWPRVIIRSESPFPFLEGLERRIADSAASTFSLIHPAMYDAILRRCCGVETETATGGDDDVMKHRIPFCPFAFRTERFVKGLKGLFDASLASENLRVRRIALKPVEPESDLLSAVDFNRSMKDLCEIFTIGSLGLALPITGPFMIANVRKKARLTKELDAVRSSVEVSLSVTTASSRAS